jgi:methyl-accepting chemotaxis protein
MSVDGPTGMLLNRLKLRTKLACLVGLSALALIASIAMGATMMHGRMVSDRVDKLRAVVETALSIAQALQTREVSHELTHAEAFARFAADVHAMRFDKGDGYLTVQDFEGVVVLHATTAAMEGKKSATKDASGTWITDLVRGALKNGDEGVIGYPFPKSPGTEPLLKTVFVERFQPWQLYVLCGVWTDDLDAAFHSSLLTLATTGGALLLLTLLAAWVIERDIAGSLDRLKVAMAELAGAHWRPRSRAQGGGTKSVRWPPRCTYSKTTRSRWIASRPSRKPLGCAPPLRRRA